MRAILTLFMMVLVMGCHTLPLLGRGGQPPRETSSEQTAQAAASESEAGSAAPPKTQSAPAAAGKVILLISFSWSNDPAEDIQKSFTYASRQAFPPFTMDVVRRGSALETAVACDSLMQQNDVRLVIYAGDEGAAAGVALLSAKHRVPVLKLTSDARSFAELSPYLCEFLPSAKRQAEVLGDYAVRDLRLAQMMNLYPLDARGAALAEGFRQGVEKAGGAVEVAKTYPPEAPNIRVELAAVFSDENRLKQGKTPLKAALTPQERAEAFGDAKGGEVLFSDEEGDSLSEIPLQGEGFFLALSPDKVEPYSTQLSLLPKGVVLLGNSSWINRDVLARQQMITEGMYISSPLLPQPAERDDLLSGYEGEKGSQANEWELLGLDAGDFVGRLMAVPKGRQELIKAIPQVPQFSGRAIIVDFGGGRENRMVRLLHLTNGELAPVR